ncbi:uncharacterized protein LOC127427950 [Myxocyprinus asiaticus]|uniref:uncharacterized protein LOC127427950 n=1 Tax=Myxocyprinus asiaticus TaxID=70543 RepID=UPI002222317B|nr:uncharacterized protein LOC127427950 [Myxocyprinus asiaticus]
MSCLYRTVVCILLMCMVCKSCSSSLGHRGPFSNSLRLTRTIRARVQQLLSRYKQQLFGDELFENRELMVRTIPAVTVNYQTWIHMKDIERLRLASCHLQTFWTHLEYQRQQLERERDEMKDRREQKRGKRGRPQPTLCQSFMGLQIDLRDLMRQVNSQLISLSITQDPESTSTKSPILRLLHSTPTPNASIRHPTVRSTPTSSRKLQTSFHTDTPCSSTHFTTESTSTSSNMKLPYSGLSTKPEKTSVGVTVTPRPPKPTQTSTVSDSRGSLLSVDNQQTTALSSGLSRWVQHLRGYVILRDLEQYLSRLARDYTVLQAKY